MAFASPASDFGFGWASSLGDTAEGFAARLRSAAALTAQRSMAILQESFGHLRRPAVTRPAARSQVVAQALRPMSLADQWSKVSSILLQSVDGARIATEMQSAATQQLDLAQYGLITLVDELSAVMTIPGRRSRGATVHAFNGALDGAGLLPLQGQALAA